jgi:hypothetical protein
MLLREREKKLNLSLQILLINILKNVQTKYRDNKNEICLSILGRKVNFFCLLALFSSLSMQKKNYSL